MVDRRKLKQFSISEIGTILPTLPNNLVMPLNGYTGLQIWNMHQRRIKTKSHYKMTCSCCKKVINRGDDITQIQGSAGALRQRESSNRTGGPRWQHDPIGSPAPVGARPRPRCAPGATSRPRRRAASRRRASPPRGARTPRRGSPRGRSG